MNESTTARNLRERRMERKCGANAKEEDTNVEVYLMVNKQKGLCVKYEVITGRSNE